ncbi:hypothetical protein [Bacillus sp. REN10]|nr:hypothetical protein [Bacillus sp. REN10]
MNDSDPMLTYHQEDRGSPLGAGAWSWTIEKRKAPFSDVWKSRTLDNIF